jgi:hypothetical protein
MTQRARWFIAMFLVGVAPLAFANVVGMRSAEGFPPRPGTFGKFVWRHGWPLALIERTSLAKPPYDFGGGSSHPTFDNSSSRVAATQDSGPSARRIRPLFSSRWPIGDEKTRSIYWGQIPPAVTAWLAILVGAGISFSNSRYVNTGKPQMLLSTWFIFITFTAIFLGLYPQFLYFGWERLAIVPLLTAASTGWFHCVALLARRQEKGQDKDI